jgi:hypothetical protein
MDAEPPIGARSRCQDGGPAPRRNGRSEQSPAVVPVTWTSPFHLHSACRGMPQEGRLLGWCLSPMTRQAGRTVPGLPDITQRWRHTPWPIQCAVRWSVSALPMGITRYLRRKADRLVYLTRDVDYVRFTRLRQAKRGSAVWYYPGALSGMGGR